ncbi:MAG: VWA domain-containing protein, partial [Solirubrobacterales bacterium]|nr:VWA domain-containing protein [Solirubrobacterales bacterium]
MPRPEAAGPGTRAVPRPDDAVSAAVVALGRGLRDVGLATSVDAEIVLCRALAELDLNDRSHVYWAARSTLARHPDDGPAFDAVFARFWAGRPPTLAEGMAEHGESDPRMPGPQHGGESMPQYRTEGRSSQLLDGQPTKATQEIPSAGSDDEQESEKLTAHGVLAAYSPAEVVTRSEPLDYAEQELVAVRRLAEELRRAVPERRSRRTRPAGRPGRLDVRTTVRGALRLDGEVLRPSYARHATRPRRLLLLCDVSGSMERYSRALLGALEAVVGSGLKAETFVFATQLTRLTGPLSGRDAARAIEQARAAIPDWSGGTRIGPSFAEFNA